MSKNFFALFLGDAASHLIGFFATVFLARLLAAEGFGLISYGMAFLSYALLFANPGLTIIGAREIARDHANRTIVEEILGLRLVLAAGIFIIFLIGYLTIPGPLTTKKIILIYSFTLFPSALSLEFVFQGREDMEYIGAARFIQAGVYLIFLLLLVRTGQEILKVPTAFIIGYTAAAFFLILIYLRVYTRIRLRFSLVAWRRWLVSAVPVGLATIFNQAYLSLPPIILGVFHSKAEVGLFSAAYKIIVMLLIIDRVFYYVLFPMITRQYTREPERLARSLNLIVRILLTIIVPIGLAGLVIGDRLLEFIYGIEYVPALPTLWILMGYFMIAPISTILGYSLISINQERRFFKVIGLVTVIDLVLIFSLGIFLRGPGAAAALFVGEILGTLLMGRELGRFVRFGIVKSIPKPLAAAIIMAGIIYFLRSLALWSLVIIGSLAYLVALYLIRGFSIAELRRLLTRLNKK